MRSFVAVLLLAGSSIAIAEDGLAIQFTISEMPVGSDQLQTYTNAVLMKSDEEVSFELDDRYILKIRSGRGEAAKLNLLITLKGIIDGKPYYVGARSLELEVGNRAEVDFQNYDTRYKIDLDSSYGKIPSRTLLKADANLSSAGSLSIPATQAPSPYRGEEAREIKTLSAEEIAALLAGEGMGFAKAAELNGYPGPAHVLALADELGLDQAQADATRQVELEMRSAAIEAGRRLVAAERELNRLFAERTITSELLPASLKAIADLRVELRRIHLVAHLRQADLLTPEQIRRYATLRGYGVHHGAHETHR